MVRLAFYILILFTIIVEPVQAVVVLPAVILIPIAKIVAIFLAGLTPSLVSIGAIIKKRRKISWKQMLFYIGLILIHAA